MSETALLAPVLRFKDLRRLRITNLPTPRCRRHFLALAVVCPLASCDFAYRAATEKPLFAVSALVFLVATYGCIRGARQVKEQLEEPTQAPYEAFDESEFGELTVSTAEAAMGAIASGTAGLLEGVVGYATKWTDRLWGLRKPGQVRRWRAAIEADLQDGERRIISCQTRLVPHWPLRLLLPFTLWTAWPLLVRRGFLSVTDQRLLFHRWSWLRRRHRVLDLSVALADVELLEWFQGTHVEARSRVLITRGPGRRLARFNIDRVWAEEAQWVFDLVASSTRRPPRFLAERWSVVTA